MRNTQLFSTQLAARILAVLGAASLAAPHASCTGSGAGGTTGSSSAHGSGGAGTGGGSGGSTGAGFIDAGLGDGGPGVPPPDGEACFDWAYDGGPEDASAGDASTTPGDGGDTTGCPSDPVIVLFQFQKAACTTDAGVHFEPKTINSLPTRNAAHQCCYTVSFELCQQGGRPYLVGDRARVSETVRGAGAGGWGRHEDGDVGDGRPRLEGLTAEERASLAAAWTADALLEHASVASFARFSLALLAAGAPADLVELAHRAALDEIRHARLCFALASAYAGETVAPGPFPVGREIEVGGSLAALAASTVEEGCVGETISAVMAAEQLARATDPAVRATLAQIADDEARHAELAWRTVAWAVQAGGAEVRAAVEQAFADALALSDEASVSLSDGAPAPSGSPRGLESGELLEAHGRLDAATRARVAAGAMVSIVVPSARSIRAPPLKPSRLAIGHRRSANLVVDPWRQVREMT